MLFVVCSGATLIATGTFAVVRLAPAALVPAGVALGGLLFAIYGLSVAHVNDLIEPSQVLEVTGGLLLVHGFGAALGPTLAGIVMNALGPGSLLVYFAGVSAMQALYTLHRMRFAPPVPAQAKAGYVAIGGSSQAVLQLDPRASTDRHDRPPR